MERRRSDRQREVLHDRIAPPHGNRIPSRFPVSVGGSRSCIAWSGIVCLLESPACRSRMLAGVTGASLFTGSHLFLWIPRVFPTCGRSGRCRFVTHAMKKAKSGGTAHGSGSCITRRFYRVLSLCRAAAPGSADVRAGNGSLLPAGRRFSSARRRARTYCRGAQRTSTAHCASAITQGASSPTSRLHLCAYVA